MSRAPSQPAPPLAASRPAWHATDAVVVLQGLESTAAGLASGEAARRLASDGPNELPHERPPRALAILLRQFRSLLVGLLVLAAGVSFALGETVDASAILAIVLVNALIGFWQEQGAERALSALRRLSAPRAHVRRDGALVEIAARELVRGDVIELADGDLVPADARLLSTAALRTVESALTGESEPVDKQDAALRAVELALGDRLNMLYAGTAVAAGRGTAVVVATGPGTELGGIAQLLGEAGPEPGTPLERRLAAVGRLLVAGALVVVALIFALGWLRGMPLLPLFLTSVSLAVAAVPEGLPAIVTIALAVGVQRMARRRALVRRLHAVETLGCTTVICSDKTGTLTVGAMTVRALVTPARDVEVAGEGYAPAGRFLDVDGADAPVDAGLRGLLDTFAACNGARLEQVDGDWVVRGDPTEGALLAAAAKGGVTREMLDREQPVETEIAFDSSRKRMTVVRRRPDGTRRAWVKGAPEVLLSRCTRVAHGAGVRQAMPADFERARARQIALGERGLRVLAAAWRDVQPGEDTHDADALERDLVWAGLAGMSDPPRPEARAAVERCRAAGIHVAMITGDHPGTALAIGRELGLVQAGEAALTGPEIELLDDEALAQRAPDVTVYARVSAEHKVRIVQAWQRRGAVVAMTGDGVNDAPAVRRADVGVAMGRGGTEVTREASDMVVTDDNFASIVAAVEEGRGIYDNIRKSLQYLLAGNAGELLFMLGCVLLALPLPLEPVQLLWINLLTDGLPALCLATDRHEPGLMRRRPRARTDSLTDRDFLGQMLLTGALTAGLTFAVYTIALRHEGVAMARAHAFTTLVYAELFRSFGARSGVRSVWSIGLRSNARLLVVVLFSAALQFAAPHVAPLGRLLDVPSMPLAQCLRLLGLGLLPLAALEAVKAARNRRHMEAGA